MDINVTHPFLPPIEEYKRFVDQIWSRNWLTNNGPLLNRLELALKERLGVDHLLFVANGTLALQLAIKALGLQGEVITTPFSYVAMTSSIVWEGCEPVMVDIDRGTLNIDPKRIEEAITERTSAILATHVFGNPCDVDAIGAIAERYGLKLIYDAAHGFGSRLRERSILGFGDVATASFHATKLFHTIEGGAVVSRSADVLRMLALMRNFGHTSPTTFETVGINAKASEFQAAMGLCNLKYVDEIIQKRREVSSWYDAMLAGQAIERQRLIDCTGYNHAYYPVLFDSEAILLKVVETLNQARIFPRRYFFPSLSKLPYVAPRHSVPVSEDVAPRVLCLPMYPTLTEEEVAMICRHIIRALKY